ncbi:hypothetical protein SKAU_G00084640 [Synaphobranchus kaupii]|uniref:Uncharacterized protein n=1 Tax=Synaphobranchus kaupii TaxID=118154 RepID=A0A9Q1FWC6_SYNKA|nr:hypothetical protein SKAU_G00084640 [Synaphobranchus kaupii]
MSSPCTRLAGYDGTIGLCSAQVTVRRCTGRTPELSSTSQQENCGLSPESTLLGARHALRQGEGCALQHTTFHPISFTSALPHRVSYEKARPSLASRRFPRSGAGRVAAAHTEKRPTHQRGDNRGGLTSNLRVRAKRGGREARASRGPRASCAGVWPDTSEAERKVWRTRRHDGSQTDGRSGGRPVPPVEPRVRAAVPDAEGYGVPRPPAAARRRAPARTPEELALSRGPGEAINNVGRDGGNARGGGGGGRKRNRTRSRRVLHLADVNGGAERLAQHSGADSSFRRRRAARQP